MALSADKNVKTREARISRYPVATATTIYKGSLVVINGAGYAVPASKTADVSEVVGVALATIVNAGANGAENVSVEAGMIAYLTAVGGAATAVGENAYAIDDESVAIAGGTGVTNLSPIVGKVVEYVSSTELGVYIPEPGADRSSIKLAVIAGGAAGAHTVTGIRLGDRLVGVLEFATAAAIATLTDLTSEFSISDADEIDNTGGTATTNDALLVIWERRN